jgi:zinc transporter
MNDAVRSHSLDDLPEEDGLLFACLLDGRGGATLKSWRDVERWTEEQGVLWAHFDRRSQRVQSWLREESDLTPVTSDAMLAEETRPRLFRGKKGVVAILRGVNLNPNAEQEDMVALRIWSDGNRVISVRHERLVTPRDILRQLVESESGPHTAAELYERLISRLTERMASLVGSIEEKLDVIEENIESADFNEARKDLSELRNTTVSLRRYLSPQREALSSLLFEPPKWFDERSRMRLRESLDQVQRYIEDLDASRDRAVVIRDEIANKLSDTMNRTMFALSIVAGVFLPLSFVTGLLGINVGGMPGIENSNAFWITCGILVLVLIAEIALFRRMKWI